MKSIINPFESKLAVLFLLVAASVGFVLRLMFVVPIAVNYKFLLHTHSHIAMLGWMYFAMIFLIKKHLISCSDKQQQYRINFIVTTVAVFGMMFSFPFTGYALVSIISSSLFIFASYHFCYLFFQDLKLVRLHPATKKTITYALIFLIISSIGPWSLAGIMASGNSGSILYSNAIYFYLHFMYDGFLIFALLALLIHFLAPFITSEKRLKTSVNVIVISGFTTVLLSFLWNIENQIFHFVGLLTALFQLYGFVLFFLSFDRIRIQEEIKERGGVFKLIVWMIFLSFVTKLLLQIISSCPWIIGKAIVIRDFVIGYIHLVFLGIISLSLFVFLFYQFRKSFRFKIASWIFVLGIVSTETILLFRGGFPSWFETYETAVLIVVSSSLLVIGSLLFFLIRSKE